MVPRDEYERLRAASCSTEIGTSLCSCPVRSPVFSALPRLSGSRPPSDSGSCLPAGP